MTLSRPDPILSFPLIPHSTFTSSIYIGFGPGRAVKGQVGLKRQKLSVGFQEQAGEESKSLSWETERREATFSSSLHQSLSLHHSVQSPGDGGH